MAEDITAPEVIEFSLSPTSVNTSNAGRIVTATVRVTDDLSGVANVDVALANPAGNQCKTYGFRRMSGDNLDGIYQVPIIIPQYSRNGNWQIGYVLVEDTAGNIKMFYADELSALGAPMQVTVNSEDAQNWALASKGAVASASSTGSGYSAAGAIDGIRNGNGNYSQNLGWQSAVKSGGWTSGANEWLEINFGQSRTINQIDVFTLRDSFNNASAHTLTETFGNYGIKDFLVQYWDGGAWQTLATVTNNDKVWRQFTFTPVSTAKIRIYVTKAPDNYARIMEVEAWG